jgi:hypothetical protein
MDLKPHTRVETIELVIPASTTQGQINFPDIPELRSDPDKDALIFAIQTYTVDSVPKTFSGNPVASFAQLQAAFLTLYVLGAEYVFKVPLLDYLNIANNSTAGTYFYSLVLNQYEPLRVDWTKSYVGFTAPLNNVAQFSYYFKITYEWYPPGTYAKFLDNKMKAFAAGLIKV